MPSLIPRQYISALYEAAFNRAPDNAGLTFWEAQYAANPATAVKNIAAGFAGHPAFTTLYGGLSNSAFVQAIYVNALGSAGDIGGITYWTSQLNNGLSRADFLSSFVSSALTADFPNPNLTPEENAAAQIRQDFLMNKANVGLFFADTLGSASNLDPQTNPNSLDSLLHDPAYLASLAVLAGVTNDPVSVTEAQAFIETAATQPDPAAYINDTGLTLTTHVDTFNIIAPGVENIVHGIVNGNADFDTSGSTYTNGDTVNGNGHTIVDLTVIGGGDAANGTLNNVADVNIIAGVIPTAGVLNSVPTTDSVTFNAVPWTHVGSVNLVGDGVMNLADGINSLSVLVEGLENGANLSIASGAAGSLSADYISGLQVNLAAGDVSTLSWTDRNVDATVAASETATFTAFMQAGDITVGHINATVGQNGFFGALVSSSASGDLTVGNVTITAGVGASASVSVDNIASGGSITVGDVSMHGGAFELFDVLNHSATGNILIGDVSMSVSASGALDLTVSNTGAAGESIGSLTVGAIDLALGNDATGSVAILNKNGFTKDGLSLGAMTVGDMNVNLGANATIGVSITQSANVVSGIHLASFGNTTIGNLTATIGNSADMVYGLDVAGINAAIGSVTVGNVSATIGAGGAFNYAATVTGDLGVSNVTFGNFDLTANNAATLNVDLSVTAASGNVGSVTVGNVAATVGAGGSFSYQADVTGNLGVNNITFGNFDLTSNNAADFRVNLDVSATSGDIGSVTVGDISLAATGTHTAAFSLEVVAGNDAGMLNIGNISIDTTADARIDVNIGSTGGAKDAGVHIAGLSFNGKDSGTYNGAFVSVSSTGDVSLGNLSVNLSITGITGTLPTLDLTTFLTSVFDTYDHIDYSGLKLSWAPGNPDAGNGVSIDLTPYKGNTSVIGSQYNDIITANAYTGDPATGIDKLTGGGGADTFVFPTNTTGKTLTTMDQVLDFSNSQGDKLNVGITPTEDTFGEGSFSNFASFVTGANAAAAEGKEVFVGSVADQNSLIVAASPHGQVDFMVQLVGITDLSQISAASFV